MPIDFLQWAAYYFIFMTMLRLLQAKFKDTEWGKAFAFFG